MLCATTSREGGQLKPDEESQEELCRETRWCTLTTPSKYFVQEAKRCNIYFDFESPRSWTDSGESQPRFVCAPASTGLVGPLPRLPPQAPPPLWTYCVTVYPVPDVPVVIPVYTNNSLTSYLYFSCSAPHPPPCPRLFHLTFLFVSTVSCRTLLPITVILRSENTTTLFLYVTEP